MIQNKSEDFHIEQGRFWSGLSWPNKSFSILDKMLSNETDMAFRRRALVLLSYLDPQASDDIIECGCGRGFYLNMLRAISECKLTGLELDTECLEIANKQLINKNICLMRANIEKLPLESNSVSKILFSEVLEHIPDEMSALREIYRVLKPGGIVALSVPNANYPFIWDPINWTLEALGFSPIRSGFLSGIWANHERLYNASDLISKTKEVGFEVEDHRALTYYCFPFAHNIVYGIGKELLIRGLLPKYIEQASDRFSYEKNEGSYFNPVNLMRAIFKSIDKFNDYFPNNKVSVVLTLKLKKPFLN